MTDRARRVPPTIYNHGGPMNVRSAFAMILVALVSGTASAGGLVALPEPGILELLAIGAVVGIAIAIRNRRK